MNPARDLLFEVDNNTNDWNIVVLADVAVHVFSPKAREFYDIESLWTARNSGLMTDLDPVEEKEGDEYYDEEPKKKLSKKEKKIQKGLKKLAQKTNRGVDSGADAGGGKRSPLLEAIINSDKMSGTLTWDQLRELQIDQMNGLEEFKGKVAKGEVKLTKKQPLESGSNVVYVEHRNFEVEEEEGKWDDDDDVAFDQSTADEEVTRAPKKKSKRSTKKKTKSSEEDLEEDEADLDFQEEEPVATTTKRKTSKKTESKPTKKKPLTRKSSLSSSPRTKKESSE